MRPAPIRVVPPAATQLASDPRAPLILFSAIDLENLSLATAATGLGFEVRNGTGRIVLGREDLKRLAHEMAERGCQEFAGLVRRYLEPVREWRARGQTFPLSSGQIMGILNLTEDSFSGDGIGHDPSAAVRRAEALREAGASIIDVGAESARADRPVLNADEEARIVGRVVSRLVAEGHCISADTYKPEVARAALEAGASILNDISGLTTGMETAEEAARSGAAYVLNYSYSVPKQRPDEPPSYEDVVAETLRWAFERVPLLRRAGLADAQIAVDPGIAFGKSHDEDLQVLRRLGEMTSLGLPLLLAHSRKNFIGSVTGHPPGARDLETHVLTALAFGQGARIFRVHDPEGARRALDIAEALAAKAGAFAPGPESWPWQAGVSAKHMTVTSPDKPPPPGQRW